MGVWKKAEARLLVLGLGNILLQDDGFGIELLRLLADHYAADERVECVDGGTQGLALLGRLADREALLILDAWQLGEPAGTLRIAEDPLAHRTSRGLGAHEGNASELLGAAMLSGVLPGKVRLLGVEPGEMATGIGLTPRVEESLPKALEMACHLVESLLSASSPAASSPARSSPARSSPARSSPAGSSPSERTADHA